MLLLRHARLNRVLLKKCDISFTKNVKYASNIFKAIFYIFNRNVARFNN